MATLTGFSRIADPIEAVGLGTKISSDIGIAVTAEMLPDFTISVTGSISESNRTAIQNSINGYIYPNMGNRYITADTTVLATDKILNVDTTAGPVNVVLFNAIGNNNRRVEIKKMSSDGNGMTLTPVSGQTIDGFSSKYTTSTQKPNYIVEADGANLWLK